MGAETVQLIGDAPMGRKDGPSTVHGTNLWRKNDEKTS
jgi:hypothetical protein